MVLGDLFFGTPKNHLEKCKIVPTFLRSSPQQEDNLMRISLADSWANGFNKWCDMHDAGRTDGGCAGADDTIIIPDRDLDHALLTPPERPHQPWLVPGVGVL